MTASDVDPWELAGFPGRLNVAAYLTADQHAAQYRVLVDVLLDAQEHSLTGISRDDLLTSVREKITAATDSRTAECLTAPDRFDIDARMKSLRRLWPFSRSTASMLTRPRQASPLPCAPVRRQPTTAQLPCGKRRRSSVCARSDCGQGTYCPCHGPNGRAQVTIPLPSALRLNGRTRQVKARHGT